jgi:tetratricopeptide (TPR) repeat protein
VRAGVFVAWIAAPAMGNEFVNELHRIRWQETLRVPGGDRPSSDRHAAMHHHRRPDARTRNSYRGWNHRNAVTGPGQGNQRLRRDAFKQHARPNVRDLAGGLEPAMRREDRAETQQRSGKHVAMENRLSPMRELLGELLLEANEPAQALKEFETSLRNNPNRYRSFAGAAKAAERAGERAQAKNHYEKLVALAAQADDGRPDLVMAKRYLAAN